MEKSFEERVDKGVVLVSEITQGISDLKDALQGEGSVEAFVRAHEQVAFLADKAAKLQATAPKSIPLLNLQRRTREVLEESEKPMEEKIQAVLGGFALAGLLARGDIKLQMEAIMAYFPILNKLITEYKK